MIYSPPIQDTDSVDLQYPDLREIKPVTPLSPNAPGRIIYDNKGNPIAVTNLMMPPLPTDNGQVFDGGFPQHPIDYGPNQTIDPTSTTPIYTMQPSPISSPTSGQTPLPNGSVTPTSTVVATPDIVTELKTFVHANPVVALGIAGLVAYLVLGKK